MIGKGDVRVRTGIKAKARKKQIARTKMEKRKRERRKEKGVRQNKNAKTPRAVKSRYSEYLSKKEEIVGSGCSSGEEAITASDNQVSG